MVKLPLQWQKAMSDTLGVRRALQLKHKTVDISPPCHVDQSCKAGKIWTSEGNSSAQNTFPCYRQLKESGLCHSCLKTTAPQCVCVWKRESSFANGQIWSWQTHVMREIKVVPNALCSCKWDVSWREMKKKKKRKVDNKGRGEATLGFIAAFSWLKCHM